MDSIKRSRCVICGGANLEHLYTLGNFPVFMGCVTQSPQKDLRMNMSWSTCSRCGTIQLDRLVPLHILYQESHNEAIGSNWQEHHAQFADFILEYGGSNRLEVGGADGMLAKLARSKSVTGRWLILDPNPIEPSFPIPNTEFRKGWFDENFRHPFEIDTVIHSHVMEHWYEPSQVIEQMNKLLQLGGNMIFSVPNMEAMLSAKYTNCLNFEHTYYLPEDIIEFVVDRHGFRIVGKKYFRQHAIFYACKKVGEGNSGWPEIPNNYQKSKALFRDFVDHHLLLVNEIRERVEQYDGPVYIFGAHIFTLYLLAFGLKEGYFLNVLDNGPRKIGKRLYGTNLMVKSPQCLTEHNDALVVLKTGIYDDEIKQDILENINPNILFC